MVLKLSTGLCWCIFWHILHHVTQSRGCQNITYSIHIRSLTCGVLKKTYISIRYSNVFLNCFNTLATSLPFPLVLALTHVLYHMHKPRTAYLGVNYLYTRNDLETTYMVQLGLFIYHKVIILRSVDFKLQRSHFLSVCVATTKKTGYFDVNLNDALWCLNFISVDNKCGAIRSK